MTVEVITNVYVRSHAKAPRGRGMWAFAFVPSPVELDDLYWTPGDTSYGIAKKLAAAEALRRGVHRVWVQP